MRRKFFQSIVVFAIMFALVSCDKDKEPPTPTPEYMTYVVELSIDTFKLNRNAAHTNFSRLYSDYSETATRLNSKYRKEIQLEVIDDSPFNTPLTNAKAVEQLGGIFASMKSEAEAEAERLKSALSKVSFSDYEKQTLYSNCSYDIVLAQKSSFSYSPIDADFDAKIMVLPYNNEEGKRPIDSEIYLKMTPRKFSEEDLINYPQTYKFVKGLNDTIKMAWKSLLVGEGNGLISEKIVTKGAYGEVLEEDKTLVRNLFANRWIATKTYFSTTIFKVFAQYKADHEGTIPATEKEGFEKFVNITYDACLEYVPSSYNYVVKIDSIPTTKIGVKK